MNQQGCDEQPIKQVGKNLKSHKNYVSVAEKHVTVSYSIVVREMRVKTKGMKGKRLANQGLTRM